MLTQLYYADFTQIIYAIHYAFYAVIMQIIYADFTQMIYAIHYAVYAVYAIHLRRHIYAITIISLRRLRKYRFHYASLRKGQLADGFLTNAISHAISHHCDISAISHAISFLSHLRYLLYRMR